MGTSLGRTTLGTLVLATFTLVSGVVIRKSSASGGRNENQRARRSRDERGRRSLFRAWEIPLPRPQETVARRRRGCQSRWKSFSTSRRTGTAA
jgi:hypothetical protein